MQIRTAAARALTMRLRIVVHKRPLHHDGSPMGSHRAGAETPTKADPSEAALADDRSAAINPDVQPAVRTHASSMRRAIETFPGSNTGASTELAQSPAARASFTSAREHHTASQISPSLKMSGSRGLATAWKPSMRERGNGHG